MSEQKLLMDDTELSISFRKAKNKREQVGVLADLNLCAPYVIAEHLESLGLLTGTGLIPENFSRKYDAVGSATSGRKTVKHRYPDKRAARSTGLMDEIRAMELYEDGLDDLAMSEALGVGVCRVEAWRKRMHLKTQKQRKKAESVKKETKPAQPPEQAEHCQTATATGEPAAAPETSPLTLGDFLRLVTELTPPAALKAPLRINGATVMEIARIVIHGSRDAAPSVEIVTEAG